MAGNSPTIRVPAAREGPVGSGNGGWAAACLAALSADPLSIGIRAPIPLDVELDVVVVSGGLDVVDGSEIILEGRQWEPDYADTAPVSIEAAIEARNRFAWSGDTHPAPQCFSCGTQPTSMNVQAGQLDDGRFATDWTVPQWSIRSDGSVDDGALWAAIDCTAAWFACGEGDHRRTAFTVQFACEVIEPLVGGETYALVGWAGDWGQDWDGRKRSAASAAFDRNGRCVARSRSFWVALD